ncbi:unnamed protein product, partial [Discosporangium mesarthrocarpum]
FNGVAEPRVHVLLGTQGYGYRYHRVSMRCLPLNTVPAAARLREECSNVFGVPFNIGVDLLVYRDGNDSCGHHADDTQGESRVVCVVVEAEVARPVHLRPKRDGKRA